MMAVKKDVSFLTNNGYTKCMHKLRINDNNKNFIPIL